MQGSAAVIELLNEVLTAELTAKHPGWPRANGIANATRAAFAEAR